MSNAGYWREFDIAVSFAGEHREYVEAAVRACERLGLSVFYDLDMQNTWWGRNYIREQRKVFSSRTRYFVPFISVEYLTKPVPTDEFSIAMMTAVQQGDGYILPVLIGPVQVPADLLHPHIGYLRAEEHTPEQLAEQLRKRVTLAKTVDQRPRAVGQVVKEALRLPRVVPIDFSRYREVQVVFDFLGDQFEAAVPWLGERGFVGTVNRGQERVAIRIEQRGETVCALDICRGDGFRDDTLSFVLGRNRSLGSGIYAYATPFFDTDAGVAKLRMSDFSTLIRFGVPRDGVLTKQELFNALWERIVEQLEVET